ncbi:hypothetical protein MCELHM10_01571 [Paracoccaceae bacterium]|jgi:hypothetical protein
MPKWLVVASWHWSVLFCVLALSATLVAWISFGLINLAMANFDFVSRHGLLALREGGLWQMIQIGAQAFVALVAYLVFKTAETELVCRWRKQDH